MLAQFPLILSFLAVVAAFIDHEGTVCNKVCIKTSKCIRKFDDDNHLICEEITGFAQLKCTAECIRRPSSAIWADNFNKDMFTETDEPFIPYQTRRIKRHFPIYGPSAIAGAGVHGDAGAHGEADANVGADVHGGGNAYIEGSIGGNIGGGIGPGGLFAAMGGGADAGAGVNLYGGGGTHGGVHGGGEAHAVGEAHADGGANAGVGAHGKAAAQAGVLPFG